LNSIIVDGAIVAMCEPRILIHGTMLEFEVKTGDCAIPIPCVCYGALAELVAGMEIGQPLRLIGVVVAHNGVLCAKADHIGRL